MKIRLLAAAVTLIAAGAHAGPASLQRNPAIAPDSLSGTVIKCWTTPGGSSGSATDYCVPSVPASGYAVNIQVYAPAGGTYSYAWTVPALPPPFGAKQSIFSGCTSTTSYCNLTVGSAGSDLDNTIFVTVTDTATSETLPLEATYWIPAVCGGGSSWC